eukprot:378823-Rhodomonas_salina.1
MRKKDTPRTRNERFFVFGFGRYRTSLLSTIAATSFRIASKPAGSETIGCVSTEPLLCTAFLGTRHRTAAALIVSTGHGVAR